MDRLGKLLELIPEIPDELHASNVVQTNEDKERAICLDIFNVCLDKLEKCKFPCIVPVPIGVSEEIVQVIRLKLGTAGYFTTIKFETLTKTDLVGKEFIDHKIKMMSIQIDMQNSNQ